MAIPSLPTLTFKVGQNTNVSSMLNQILAALHYLLDPSSNPSPLLRAGYVGTTGATSVQVTFTPSFPNGSAAVVITPVSSALTYTVVNLTTAGFQASFYNPSNGTAAGNPPFEYIAVGS